MIEDSKREAPRFKGTMHGMKMIVAEEGYRGIYRGLGPVVRYPYFHVERSCSSIDAASGSQFSCSIHIIFHLEAASTRKQYTREPATCMAHIWDWSQCGRHHRLYVPSYKIGGHWLMLRHDHAS